MGAGAGTSNISHLLPIWIPLMADLHPQAFSPEPQSIQNKPWLFIRSCKSMQTSAVLSGCVGPRRLRQSQCRPGMQSWWQRAEKGSFWRGHGAPLALTWKGLGVLASGLSGGIPRPLDAQGPSPEAAPGVLVTRPACTPCIWGWNTPEQNPQPARLATSKQAAQCP